MLPLHVPSSLAGAFCSPGAWGPCSACRAESSCSALELWSPGVAVPAPWLLAPGGLCGQQTQAQLRSEQSLGQSFYMSLVGGSFHRSIFCRYQEGSVGSFQDLVSQHSWLPLQDTCLCPCTTDLETRKFPQEMPGPVLLTAPPAWICPVQVAAPAGIPSGSGEGISFGRAPAPCSQICQQLPFHQAGLELPPCSILGGGCSETGTDSCLQPWLWHRSWYSPLCGRAGAG